MSAPTPVLEFFKRGEVARDVRLLAAQGVFAPRAHEQLAILILLLNDSDPEVRSTAEQTINALPGEALRSFLGRSDVPVGVLEFFADRGIFPSEIPLVDADAPLLDADAADDEDEGEDAQEETSEGTSQKLAKMGFTEKLRAAMKGSREMRGILIRDSNKLISSSVLSSPKVTEQEIENFARMANVSEDVLRIIGSNRVWMKNYGVVVGLTKNPKTPLAMSMNLMNRLNDRDLSMLSIDRNVPEPLRIAARKRSSAAASKK